MNQLKFGKHDKGILEWFEQTFHGTKAGATEIETLKLLRLKLLNEAFRAIPGSPRQQKIKEEINRIEYQLSVKPYVETKR